MNIYKVQNKNQMLGTTEEEEREADRKKGGDLKDTKISDKEAKKENQNYSKPQFNERFYPKRINYKLAR